MALREAPTAAAETVYSGVLYDALGLADLDPASRRRARAWIVVISALWGAVRLGDRIPPYRLNMCGRLPGLAHLTGRLAGTARRGAARRGRPGRRGRLPLRRVRHGVAAHRGARRADRGREGVPRPGRQRRGVVSHNAKHTRGLVVRRIVTDAIDPRRPEGLAEALSEHFEIDLRRPERPGRTWELHVVEPAL